MKKLIRSLSIVIVSFFLVSPFFAATPNKGSAPGKPSDPGWPRRFKGSGQEVVVYQPQVDSWDNYTKLHYRAAISVKGGSIKRETFGVAEGDAETVVDPETRTVVLKRTDYELRFSGMKPEEAAVVEKSVRQIIPPSSSFVMSLDRVLALLDPAKQSTQQPVEVSVDPPKILYSPKSAILVMFIGAPEFKPVDKDQQDLMFAANTNWDVFFDTTDSRYYLLNGDNWLTASDPLKGPWTAAVKLPAGVSKLPPNENWSDVSKNIPGKKAKEIPSVFVTTEPTEMIVTRGQPAYAPITGTKLMRVSNTGSTIFLNSADKQYYFLVAGRWFRAGDLSGPWTAASNDLPKEFAAIPDDSAVANVKSSVPGTEDAKDAVLLASVPRTTTVKTADAKLDVIYKGDPKFVAIKGANNVQYATNSPNTVFLVNGGYYCCDKGTWFCGGTAKGPWAYCTAVPKNIYTIPANHPAHNVTYVTVQSSTPTTVVYSQTSGYSGEYVAANGVLMFGAGLLVGALIANNNDCDYCRPPPYYYSYGCGAHYHYGYGGYYGASHYYGPYGGAGRSAAYNPYTGTYSRGAYAYGPAGGAVGVRQAYNPYTDTYAARAVAKTPYGSSGRFYAEQGNKSAWGGHESGARGTVAWAESSKGGQAVAWDTRNSQGAVAKDKNGNVYVGHDGEVYKKNQNGDWKEYENGGWNDVEGKPKPNTNSAAARQSENTTRQSNAAIQDRGSAQQNRPTQTSNTSAGRGSRDSLDTLDQAANARTKGDRRTSQVSQFQRGGGGGFERHGGGGGGRSKPSGGGRRR
jgi:hypothetical protein